MYNKDEIMKLGLETRAEYLLIELSKLSLKLNGLHNGLIYTNHLATIKEHVDELLQIQNELDGDDVVDREPVAINGEFDFSTFGPEPTFNKGDSDDIPF